MYYYMEGPKTNNHVEGWHKINCAAGKAHSNTFELVELSKQNRIENICISSGWVSVCSVYSAIMHSLLF